MTGRLFTVALLLAGACSSSAPAPETDTTPAEPAPPAEDPTPAPAGALADVVAVEVSGEAGAYRFSVALRSPDTGCDQYADWWEVITPEGRLIYRRVLGHSHVDEQPFTRSGGPADLQPGSEVIVRAHMNPDGYGGAVMRGSVAAGFSTGELEANFASELADQAPLPQSCAF